MNARPLLTVCVPAYNRATLLPPLLHSILSQDFEDFNVLLCEDYSPERDAIAAIVRQYQDQYPGRIRYQQNNVNLGYDGNLRRLVALADGRYCLFMGNDDLLCAHALKAIACVVDRHPQCGVVVRTYASFEEDPAIPKQIFRYFPDEYVMPGGQDAIAAAYRRSVVISGMVIHRDAALAIATDCFDGTLLYQLYLVGMICAKRSVVFVPDVIALRRDGNVPDFGNSASEKGKFVPRDQTPASSIHFMAGMLRIAEDVQRSTGLSVVASIRRDIGNYSYPILSIQAHRPLFVFLQYGIAVARLGLWRYALFYVYFAALLLIGPKYSDQLISWIKNRLGHTPSFGGVHGGRR